MAPEIQVQLVHLDSPVSLARWVLLGSQVSPVLREHRELLASKGLQETLAHRDRWDLLDRRVSPEILVHKVSLGGRDQLELQEQLDSQVSVFTIFLLILI